MAINQTGISQFLVGDYFVNPYPIYRKLHEESAVSEEFDLDSLIAELDPMAEPDEPISGFAEIKRDVEGYLRVKGLTLKEFINKVRNSGGED